MENTIIGARRGAARRAPEFAGFPPEALPFFRSLERNNRREWFQPRKHIFDEKVRAPMVELVDAINRAMLDFAPGYVRDPSAAIYRIYRDTRFSPDKTPYKTHVAAIFPRRGLEKHSSAGFYFSVSHKEIEVAGGVYMPAADELRAIRLHLLEHHEEFRALAGVRRLRTLMGEMQGQQLTRPPKGFPKDHPAEDLVRYKQWLWFVTLDPQLAGSGKLFIELVNRFRVLTPLMDFLNAPLNGAKKKPPVLWE
ncbi:MAG TPA: DUF2461 domain-containing protein [Bryobacteraceae bacterium]|nr:DUF2461 domain-containing protein [Bryobacteraceae bacterium]